MLLENFGEAEGFGACGTCDNCTRIAAAVAAAERERDAEAEMNEGAADAAPAASLPERGELVSVPRYGQGIVDAVDTEGVTVVFPEGSRRVFLPAFVRRRAPARQGSRRREKLTASAA